MIRLMKMKWRLGRRAQTALLAAAALATPLWLAASPVVSLGARGSDVSLIQQQLRDLGYHPGTVRGIFDTTTQHAVLDFQHADHIQGHGGVGSKTESALKAALAKRYSPTQYGFGLGIIKPSQYGAPVMTLQHDLHALGYHPGAADGVYNATTEAAVEKFQVQEGLHVTGQFGRVTATKLLSALKKPYVLGFYTQYEANATGSQDSLASHVNQVSAIAPLWYSFRANGSLHDLGYHYASVRAYAKAHHVAIYPMIINGFENAAVVDNSRVRASVISQLTSMAKADDYAGYNIDFEGLNPDARAGMNAFIEQLAQALDPLGKTISVDVPPKSSPNNSYAMPYDFQVLGRYANQVILMTYDYHSVGTPAGPVAPYPWMISTIQYALTRMPASKLVLGLAAYGYDWSSTGQTVEYHDDQMIQLAKQEGAPIKWNAVNKEFTFHYVQNGVNYTAWFEDGYSDKFRMELATQYHLGGIAMWRLGDENPQFWTEVAKTGW